MATLMGYGTRGVQYVPATNQQVSVGGPTSSATMDAGAGLSVIDGTPVRVVVMTLAAAAGLAALRLAGFRFSVGVSA